MDWHPVIAVQQQTPDNDFCHFSISNVRFAFWAFFENRKNSGLKPGQNDDPVTRTWKMTQMTDWPGDPMTQFHVCDTIPVIASRRFSLIRQETPLPQTNQLSHLDLSWICRTVVSALLCASVLWRCWIGGIRPLKTERWGAGVVSVWSKVQTCIWPSWCHCNSLSLASVESRLVLPFWYPLTRVVPDKRPLNGCVCCVRNRATTNRGNVVRAYVSSQNLGNSIDIFCLSGPQQQTHSSGGLAGTTERQTDRRTDGRPTVA